MSLKLKEWANIAEIISGVAILVTLILLTIEIKQNTNEVQAATYQEMISQMTDWRIALSRDRELSRNFETIWQGGEWGEIEKEQQASLNFFMNALWGMYENAYFARRRGVVGDAEWSRWEKMVCQLHYMDQEMWPRRERFLSDDFLAFLKFCENER